MDLDPGSSRPSQQHRAPEAGLDGLGGLQYREISLARLLLPSPKSESHSGPSTASENPSAQQRLLSTSRRGFASSEPPTDAAVQVSGLAYSAWLRWVASSRSAVLTFADWRSSSTMQYVCPLFDCAGRDYSC